MIGFDPVVAVTVGHVAGRRQQLVEYAGVGRCLIGGHFGPPRRLPQGPEEEPTGRGRVAFLIMRLSGDYGVSVAVGCPVWMLSWQVRQTTRVLRRVLAMSCLHPDGGAPGSSRSASLPTWCS